jgi:hypothetical protein
MAADWNCPVSSAARQASPPTRLQLGDAALRRLKPLPHSPRINASFSAWFSWLRSGSASTQSLNRCCRDRVNHHPAAVQFFSRAHRVRQHQTGDEQLPDYVDRRLRAGHPPQPRSGAPKAQDLTAAIAVAAPSFGPSIAPDDPVKLNSAGADVSMNAFATSRIYTSLTDATSKMCRRSRCSSLRDAAQPRDHGVGRHLLARAEDAAPYSTLSDW